MEKWVNLTGTRHVTNFIHMIAGSGHLVYYVKQFGNLYKYSNQGWESLNQKLKRVYMNNTNHGGNADGAKQLNKGHVVARGTPLAISGKEHIVEDYRC